MAQLHVFDQIPGAIRRPGERRGVARRPRMPKFLVWHNGHKGRRQGLHVGGDISHVFEHRAHQRPHGRGPGQLRRGGMGHRRGGDRQPQGQNHPRARLDQEHHEGRDHYRHPRPVEGQRGASGRLGRRFDPRLPPGASAYAGGQQHPTL